MSPVHTDLSDGELVRRIARDSSPALEHELCARLITRVRGFAWRNATDAAAAADLVQDVLLVVLDAARQGRIAEPDRLVAYALGTCRHLGRRRWQRMLSIELEVDLLADVTEPWIGCDLQRLHPLFEQLEPQARAVLMMTFHGWSSEEIGEALGITANHVRQIRFRALARLRAELIVRG